MYRHGVPRVLEIGAFVHVRLRFKKTAVALLRGLASFPPVFFSSVWLRQRFKRRPRRQPNIGTGLRHRIGDHAINSFTDGALSFGVLHVMLPSVLRCFS